MLKDTFFRIQNITEYKATNQENFIQASYHIDIKLDPDHPIYKGHFPNNPVVPGVCQLRMVTEIISALTGRSLKLAEADNVKFLSMINPSLNPSLTVDCVFEETEEEKYQVTASISDQEKIYFKCKAILV